MSVPINVRLLYAARSAYDIPFAAGSPPPEYGLRVIGAWTGGVLAIDAAFVAEADEGIVLAFRGTLPPSSPDPTQTVVDWLNDADAIFVPGGDLPGRVHQGFRNSLNNLWPQLEATLLGRIAAAPATTPVYVTGHSKGGSVVFLAAMRLQMALTAGGRNNPVYVCTFAAARPADQDFADAFDQTVPHAIRYEYADDIVPHIPPENVLRGLLGKIPFLPPLNDIEEGFVSPGDLYYLERGSTPQSPHVGDSPILELQRIASIAALAVKFAFGTIVADHSIEPGSGYANAISGGS